MAVNFIKTDYRFVYLDCCHEKHIFDFVQYTDSAAIQTINEIFQDSEVTPIALYDIVHDIPIFDEHSEFCKGCVLV